MSTELSIDLAAPLPLDGSVLTGRGWPVSLEPGGGLGQGTVTDGSGALVATATTRERFLPAPRALLTGSGRQDGARRPCGDAAVDAPESRPWPCSAPWPAARTAR